MLRKIILLTVLCFIISSCDIADLMNTDNPDCEKFCTKKAECSEIEAGEQTSCSEGCRDLIKYGYFQEHSGKKINDCLEKKCEEYRYCLNNVSCSEPDYEDYVNTRCIKFDKCCGIIGKVTCIVTGMEVIGTEVRDSLLKCSTDKLYDDVSNCINKAPCEMIEYSTESCLEYYYIMKAL